jgi:hypothetical protein
MSNQGKTVVFINGPAGSGKDTVAGILSDVFGYRTLKMVAPAEEAFKAFFGLDDETYRRMREQEKAVPQERLFGRTPRRCLISISEEWAKPAFGADVFGRLAGIKVSASGSLRIAFSDAGFKEEILVASQDPSISKSVLIRMHRSGKTFDGDSRSYVRGFDFPELDVYNDGTLHELRDVLTQIVKKMEL